ncbi:beta-ketoacyl-ACP synthase [Arenimonas fontis]|uniref:Beta-ketoacyl-ACP synthase n=1 Tax=Arenimonas fontis TaxID=2608255 RepID=A0A5B2ZD63_9GAMM|nr:beta-ketoacyl-ACP synthase [Arenimonas fontis]KAA2285957.1 beta-ketoacyl-ACP synthase [Arenimonas fontis]
MSRRVVVTGRGVISPLGHDWPSVRAWLKSGRNAVRRFDEWGEFRGLNTRLGVPCADFELPAHYTRKATRAMGRVALLATLASERALADAGLLGDPILGSGKVGISYGSSAGTPASMSDFGRTLAEKNTQYINATTYIRMMAHTAPVNMGVFFGITGRIVTTCSACTSGSQGIGYAYEAIRSGRQLAMLAGGSEELDVTSATVFDTLFATSTRNDEPDATPRPFDAGRDGLVVGEGACTLVLEELEHALARGARIHGEIVGYGTNSDGRHVTQPNADTMAVAMRLALEDADLPPEAIGYVSAHGTATDHGDVAESAATAAVLGNRIPISALKSYTGHTLGACGSLEAWVALEMMREGWMHPTLNLREPDPRCAELDYIAGEGRAMDIEYAMSNNFAFGGINTSLILRRWPQ